MGLSNTVCLIQILSQVVKGHFLTEINKKYWRSLMSVLPAPISNKKDFLTADVKREIVKDNLSGGGII